MELEEAKKLLKEMQENCIKGMIRGIIYTDEKAEQKSVAIDTVLQALEELQQKEKSRIIGNINEIKIEDLKPILKPYYIPIEKIKNKIEEYTDYLIKGEDCTYCNNTCRNYARCMLLQQMKRELLEE